VAKKTFEDEWDEHEEARWSDTPVDVTDALPNVEAKRYGPPRVSPMIREGDAGGWVGRIARL